MSYQRPFVTSRFTAYEGESVVRRLSLAVQVVDDLTGQAPKRRFNVSLLFTEQDILIRPPLAPILNLSGYHCFVDLPDGTFTLELEPDPVSAGYHPKPLDGQPWDGVRHRVEIPRPNRKQPVVVIRLAPNTGYSFPAHATLVHGQVARGTDPVVGAEVSADYSKVNPDDFEDSINETVSTLTDNKGFYVLYFKVPFVTPQNIDVVAKADGLQNSQPAILKEGETTAVDTIPLP